jgi:hypothetical protein
MCLEADKLLRQDGERRGGVWCHALVRPCAADCCARKGECSVIAIALKTRLAFWLLVALQTGNVRRKAKERNGASSDHKESTRHAHTGVQRRRRGYMHSSLARVSGRHINLGEAVRVFR